MYILAVAGVSAHNRRLTVGHGAVELVDNQRREIVNVIERDVFG